MIFYIGFLQLTSLQMQMFDDFVQFRQILLKNFLIHQISMKSISLCLLAIVRPICSYYLQSWLYIAVCSLHFSAKFFCKVGLSARVEPKVIQLSQEL